MKQEEIEIESLTINHSTRDFEGEPATIKSALYSFGIIMLEIYTRAVPYSNEHPIRVVNKILYGYRPTLPADCPQAYKLVC